MPEYLSPAVYVEEINTGSKPIEGVSTSTTGMVGVTERGPENVPILVTSNGDFSRTFGGQLDIREFTDPVSGSVHAYLPHSVEGYFTNGGRRDYVIRVLPDEATHAGRPMFDRGAVDSADTLLLRSAPRTSGTQVNQPLLYALLDANLANNDMLRVGDGSRAEYRQIANIGANNLHVAANFPLNFSFTAGAAVDEVARSVDTANYGTGDFVLANPANAGATSIELSAGATANDLVVILGLPGDSLFEIGDPAIAEYVTAIAAADLGGGVVRLTLNAPLLMDYVAGADVNAIELPAPITSAVLEVAANSGDLLVYLDDLQGAFNNIANLIYIDDGSSAELRRIGELSSLTLDLGAYVDYPQASLIQLVNMTDYNPLVAAAAGPANTATAFDVDDISGLAVGMAVNVAAEPVNTIAAIDATASRITLQAALPGGIPANGDVIVPASKTLTAAAAHNSIIIALNNRLGIQAGDVLRVGTAPDEEYVTVAAVSAPRSAAPDAGTVQLTTPLVQAHAAGVEVARQWPAAVDPVTQPAFSIFDTHADHDLVYVNDGNVFAAGDVLRLTTPAGSEFYHVLAAANVGLDARSIELGTSLNVSHVAGSPVVEREALFDVQALDRGGWGNRLLMSVQDEQEGLASRAEVSGFNQPQELNLTTLNGVEAGTVLELRAADDNSLIGAALKVNSVDRSANNLVVLDGAGLSPAQVAALNAAQMAGVSLPIRSREFALTAYLLERPHPAVPTRNEDIRDSETFRHLSMDHRHSRYIHRIIGTTWVPGNTEDDDGNPLRLADQRSEGESAYIRVRDRAQNVVEAESIRLGPEGLIDVLASGRQRPARHRLGDTNDPAAGFLVGSDSVNTMNDAMYQGNDSNEPRERTGIFALNNIQDLSLVAVPGQTGAAVQQALIDHCEANRYRFAVLDAQGPNNDSLVDVQFQRQQFDSKYAAIYHPWLTIPEPMPANLATIRQTAIPPSGHVLGIFARTDNERGVHKAPANTVVRGITGVARSLNKGEHDILNPFPRNINVVRDFREDNRGIRVWGARVITSDSDYKYVNVRRLLIFIESSIDRGLQWVVFEPNEEDLWARVRRAISNFLTVAWRNGALEGERPDQAFFVKCDRTTMTQTDIDNGRLICVVGVAPVKPAEFVIVRIGLWTANTQQ